MIEKERGIPIEILKDKALLRRTRPTIPRRAEIEERLAKRIAGYYGELAADRELRFLPENDYHIFNDLRLPSGPFHFQIDTLILSHHYALINEIKNIIGTLFFEPHFHQLIRSHNGTEDAFKDPITQAKRQKQQLDTLFQSWNFGNLPIEYVVVISNPSTKLDTSNPISKQKVCFAHRIPEQVELLNKIHHQQAISQKEMKKLIKYLLKHHTPREYNPLQFYGIKQTEIIPGVQCPKCLKFAMVRQHGTWFCPICTYTSKIAHIPTLLDYFFLINTTITNRQCVEFLHLPSPTVANYLLSKLDLTYFGSTKGRVYELDRLMLRLQDYKEIFIKY
ncbi:nuclease-related domain-containing protein [Neobacillus sp. LXY-4]|uniref:nuclease-related domain-containing protein n=1 Tax=Neobacillus sp. LXY-4 TaxID=3379826 RepID=UPI003EE30F7C